MIKQLAQNKFVWQVGTYWASALESKMLDWDKESIKSVRCVQTAIENISSPSFRTLSEQGAFPSSTELNIMMLCLRKTNNLIHSRSIGAWRVYYRRTPEHLHSIYIFLTKEKWFSRRGKIWNSYILEVAAGLTARFSALCVNIHQCCYFHASVLFRRRMLTALFFPSQVT